MIGKVLIYRYSEEWSTIDDSSVYGGNNIVLSNVLIKWPSLKKAPMVLLIWIQSIIIFYNVIIWKLWWDCLVSIRDTCFVV